jgi:glycosyltransferase involved in cell wall biosynthesis
MSEEKPHLLFSAFAEVPGPGSLGTRVYQLVSVFSDDFDVDGITLKGKDLSHIQRLGTARMLRVPVDGKPFLERLSSFQRALQRQLTGDSYQLVYCADIFSAQIAAAFKESRGYALVVEVNDLPAESYTHGYPIDAPTPALRSTWKDIERQALRAADVVIAPSRNAARILSSHVDPRRVQILSRAVDLGVFHPAEGEVATAGRDTIVVVGRREIAGERKAALDILSALAAHMPETRIRLVLAGQSAMGDDTIQHELVSSGLVGRVESVDIDSPIRLANTLIEAAVVVIPTKAEADISPFAIPHRALEAMACRRATVITGDAEVFSEMLVPGREAVVVEPKRPLDVVQAVVRLLESPAERSAIAHAGHARVRAQADLQKRMAEFAVIITAATGVRMTPRAPESTVRGEWSASGAYSPNGFQNLTDDRAPGLVGPSLDHMTVAAIVAPSETFVPEPSTSQISAAIALAHALADAHLGPAARAPHVDGGHPDDALHTAANPASPRPSASATELSGHNPPSVTMIASQPPSSDASGAFDQWGGDTAIEPDGAFDSSSEPSSEPARIARPTFQALADDDEEDGAQTSDRRQPPISSPPARPPPLPRRDALMQSQALATTATPPQAQPTIVIAGLEPHTGRESFAVMPDALQKVSAESDPFLSTGPSTRPEPARPPDMRPSLDRTARVRAGPDDRSHGRRTVADVPTGQTSSAEPWPANLGPLARAPLLDHQSTAVMEASPHVPTDLPSANGAADPWAPDTVFDAVPLFPSSEKKPDASDERGQQRSAVDGSPRQTASSISSTQAHALKTKTASSFLVDKIVIDRGDGGQAADHAAASSSESFPRRSLTLPIEGEGAGTVPLDDALPSLERAPTEPHAAPQSPTDSSSKPAVRTRAVRAVRASDKSAKKAKRTPVIDDEDLFSDADGPFADDPDMTMEDASLPSKPSSSSKP